MSSINNENKRDATPSCKGYIDQLIRTINYIHEYNNLHEIKFEGLEDVDLFINNKIICIQVKYHSLNSKTKENLIVSGNFFKVFKSFIFNNQKYNNVEKIIYLIDSAEVLLGTKDFIQFIDTKQFSQKTRELYLSEFEKYNNNQEHIYYKKFDDIRNNYNDLIDTFLLLINIEYHDYYKIDFNEYYNKMINSNKYNIPNINAPYINEY